MSSPVQALAGVPNACQVLPGVVTGGQPSPSHLAALHAVGGAIVLDLSRHCMRWEARSCSTCATRWSGGRSTSPRR
jgi:hypothetical protein